MLSEYFAVDGREYRKMRICYELTQNEVAAGVGISRHSLSSYEYGKADMPLMVSIKLDKYFKIRAIERMDGSKKAGIIHTVKRV